MLFVPQCRDVFVDVVSSARETATFSVPCVDVVIRSAREAATFCGGCMGLSQCSRKCCKFGESGCDVPRAVSVAYEFVCRCDVRVVVGSSYIEHPR